ncbi:DUF5666 domain-containing protein [Nocardia sp. NPDC088792]|uniref:DUF5666 domain-containing protein n=1 Tax=Nocardia sp. NPDC088792 TaxID=3364332 RepID=UPI0038102800
MTNSTPAEQEPAPRHSRRRRINLALGAVTLAVAGVVGLAACSSNGGTSSSTPTSSQAQSQTPQPGSPGGHGGPRGGAFGTIKTEGSGSWLIIKQDGSSETVTINAQTQFGTKEKQETATQFAVGDKVRVEGQEANGTITATRIEHARERMNPSGSPSANPSGAPAPSATPTN